MLFRSVNGAFAIADGTAVTVNASGLLDADGIVITANAMDETTDTAKITGSKGPDSITGGAGNDTITGGEGSDVVVASVGEDTISFTETLATTDYYKEDLAGATGFATINGFAEGSGADVIWLASTALAGGNGVTTYANTDATKDDITANFSEVAVTTLDTTAELTIAATATDFIYEVSGTAATLSATNATSATSVASLLDNVFDFGDTTAADQADVLFIVSDGTDSYLWFFNGGTADVTIDAAELDLVGVVTGVASGGFTADDFAG